MRAKKKQKEVKNHVQHAYFVYNKSMSDKELKELIASLAIDRKREAAEREKEAAERERATAEREKEAANREKFNRQMNERHALMDEWHEKFMREMQELSRQTEEFRRQTEEYSRKAQQRDAETDRQRQKDYEKSMREIEEIKRIQDKVSAQIGGSENNKGEVTEEFFVQAFKKTKQIGDIQFDHAHPRYSVTAGKQSVLEVDILLLNDMWCAVVEVKYKCHPNDVTQFYEKHDKILTILARQSFHPYYPKKYIFALASNIFIPDCVKRAHKHGIALITPAGQALRIDSSHVREYNVRSMPPS